MSIAQFPRRFTDNPHWYADCMVEGGKMAGYTTADWLSCLRYLGREAKRPSVSSMLNPSRELLAPRHYRYAMRAVRLQIMMTLIPMRAWRLPVHPVRRYA